MKQRTLKAHASRWHLLATMLLFMLLPLTATADPIPIYSQKAWNNFIKSYDGEETVLKLYCDLTFEATGFQIKNFKGTLDGQGHSFIINYEDEEDSAPFKYFEGTIKNLKLTGYVKYRSGRFSKRMSVPLIYSLEKSTVVIENCLCDVQFTECSSIGTIWNTSHIGGFIGEILHADSHATFRNCAFTGSFSYTSKNLKWMDTSGFVGYQKGGNVTFENCLSCFTLQDGWTVESLDHFVGTSLAPRKITLTNCYGYCNISVNNKLGATEATNTTIKSGEVTYKLNNGRKGDDAVWMQTIGTDAIPQLRTFSPNSLEVFYTSASSYTIGTAGWGTLYYPTAVTLPSGAKAYTVSKVEDGNLVLAEVSGTVPARTPVIICTLSEGQSETQQVTIPLVSNYYNKYASTGVLKGVYERTAAPNGSYIMQNHDGTVAFYQVDTSVAQPYVPAWRCYLDLPDEQQSHAKMNLSFESGGITGIDNGATVLEPQLRDGAVYDLQGRKVQTLQKGKIYIKNGKKFIVK